jgi:hypothetical protein
LHHLLSLVTARECFTQEIIRYPVIKLYQLPSWQLNNCCSIAGLANQKAGAKLSQKKKKTGAKR